MTTKSKPEDILADLEATHGADAVETICQEIDEMMWDPDRRTGIPEGQDGSVSLAENEMINATNHVATGSFWLGGTEYAFEYESGDRNGSLFRSLSADTPIPEVDIQRTRHALAPRPDLVDRALAEGRGDFLLMKWDAFLQREGVASIPGKYDYDRTFAPGEKTEVYWRDKAAETGFVIVPEEDATEIRGRLRGVDPEPERNDDSMEP